MPTKQPGKLKQEYIQKQVFHELFESKTPMAILRLDRDGDLCSPAESMNLFSPLGKWDNSLALGYRLL